MANTNTQLPEDAPANILSSLLRALAGCEIVDLSQDLARIRPDGPFRTRMEVLEPTPGARFLVEQLLPKHFPQGVGKITPDSFPDAAFLRHEMLYASTHAGSHVDAPGHYGGALGVGSYISEAPLSDFIAEAVYVDGLPCADEEVSADYVLGVLREHTIDEVAGKIVLIRTAERKAIGVDAVKCLVDLGVRVIGTDSDSFDGAYQRMLHRYLTTHDSGCLWPCHMLGRTRPYYQLENLANLHRLPVQGFMVWAPPVLIGGATAAWSRVLAIVPNAGSTR